MGIGASIFLIALGAILAFALNLDAANVGSVAVDWDVVGFILIAAGIGGLLWTLMVLRPRATAGRSTVVERRVDDPVDPGVGPRV